MVVPMATGLGRLLRVLAALAVGAAACWVAVDIAWEMYGPGPPYYGRTANMDKWTSPWPLLLAVCGIALVATGVIWPRRR
jgi:hypothetical protein